MFLPKGSLNEYSRCYKTLTRHHYNLKKLPLVMLSSKVSVSVLCYFSCRSEILSVMMHLHHRTGSLELPLIVTLTLVAPYLWSRKELMRSTSVRTNTRRQQQKQQHSMVIIREVTLYHRRRHK